MRRIDGVRQLRPMHLTALVFVLVLCVAGSSLAAPALNSDFGDGGVVRTPLPKPIRSSIANSGKGPLIEDLASQRNGRIVGALASGAETPFLGAVRYRPGGALDRSFGDGGFADLEREFPGVEGEAQGEGVALQQDGRILVAGYRAVTRYRESRPHRFSPLLVRLRPDGRPDPGFGTRGLVSSKPRGSNGEGLHDVAVQRGSGIVAVGARNEFSGGKPAGTVVAYRPDGSIDRRFGRGGRVLFSHRREGYTALRDVAVLPSGKLLVAGYLGDRFVVARLRPGGGLDRSFGRHGKVLLGRDLGACCPSDATLSLLPEGGFLALSAPLGGAQTLFRFEASGHLDRSFGHRGALRGAWMRKVGLAGGLAVQGNGRIVISGTSGRVRTSDRTARSVISILRALPNGTPDRSFGRNGTEFLPLGYNAVGTSALALGNGGVVVGGGTQVLAGPQSQDRFGYELVLARLHR
jgi:uncharacterized delta-60 repeat protein